jgi:hypothetical protein
MSEPNGQGGTDSNAALGQLAEDARLEPGTPDPWFGPGPKPQGYQPLDPDEMDAAGWPKMAGNGNEAGTDVADVSGVPAASGAGQYVDVEPGGLREPDEWFLRTGRAGLLPDSMTESWGDEDTHVFERIDTASAPPWAGERQEQQVEEPPPWESGPWPGPGEEMPARQPRAGEPRLLRRSGEDTDNWLALIALIAGIAPLVVPGAVLGVLGLRRARSSGTGRMQSWLGIGFSAIWAIVLIVVLSSGGSGPGCSASSQAAVTSATTTVVHDLSSGAPTSTLTTDLGTAISQANSAAAAAQQVTVRSAFVTLTTGLQRTLATVQAGHATTSYATMASELSADSTAVSSACKG